MQTQTLSLVLVYQFWSFVLKLRILSQTVFSAVELPKIFKHTLMCKIADLSFKRRFPREELFISFTTGLKPLTYVQTNKTYLISYVRWVCVRAVETLKPSSHVMLVMSFKKRQCYVTACWGVKFPSRSLLFSPTHVIRLQENNPHPQL